MTFQHIEARLAAALAVAAMVFLAPAPAAQAGADEAAAAGAGVLQGTSVSQGTGVSQSAAQPALSEVEKEWGVQIIGIRISAAGSMLDFRYRVLDPEKAAPILDRQIRPYLIDQASGVAVGIKSFAQVGRLRQNTMRPEAGRIYFMMFTNPGFPKDSKVTVVVGEFRAEDITVEG